MLAGNRREFRPRKRSKRTLAAKLSLCWGSMEGVGLMELIKAAADVLSVPGEKFFALQLDDAPQQPMDDILDETLNHRALPGEGCIDLVQTLKNLNSIGAELIYDVEVFKESLRGETTAERARQLFQSSQRVVEQL